MNYQKILFGLAVVVFCFVAYSYSLTCYYCDNKKSCEKPKKYTCTPQMANNTRAHLDIHHKNVPMNTTSPYFECFRETLKVQQGDYYYRSCIYQNIRGCDLPLRDALTQGKYERTCNQCNRDKCNSAGRADINLSTMLAPTIIMALIAKYVRSN